MNLEKFHPDPAQKKSLEEKAHYTFDQSEGGILARRKAEKTEERERKMRERLEQEDVERKTMVRREIESLAVIIFERQKEKEKYWEQLAKAGRNDAVNRDRRGWEEALAKTIQEKAEALRVDSSLVREQIEVMLKELREREKEK